MIPELEKPRVTEIKVRMDCNGCIQKIKKALYGINGIYDLYIDIPQQKLTIIGWADPERIMKAIKKTRKIATICSDSEQTDPQAAAQPQDHMQPNGGEPPNFTSTEAPPPSHDVAMAAGPPGHSHTEVAPGHIVIHDAHSGPHSNPTNATSQQPGQPQGSYEAGQVHVTHHQPLEPSQGAHHYSSDPGHVQHQGPDHGHVISHQPEHSHVHHQPPEYGHTGHQPYEHGHVVSHQPEHSHTVHPHQPPDHSHAVHTHQPPDHSHAVHPHQPPDHSHVVHHHQPPEHSQGHHVVHHHQPPEHSQGHVVHHHQPPEHSQGHVVHHHQPEYGRTTSGYNYHHNIPGASMSQPTVIHSYNTYKPSPYITEYVRPLTSHRPSQFASEYIPQQPTTHYSPRMDRYNEDYYNTGTSSNNGNITSIFSDENPNACNLM